MADPIGWFAVVLPALVLNYFGQGALLIANPAAIGNPFYLSFPGWSLYPMVVLATAATVIASQASITGTASLTRQAIQLGYLPRFNIVQTSARAYGQIYIPGLNWFLLVMVLAAVLGFGSSSRLAQAYGVALTGTMLVTTVLTFFVVRYAWRYPLVLCLAATGFFFVIDVTFFSSAMLKGAARRLVPARGRRRGVHHHDDLAARARGDVPALNESAVPLKPFLESLFQDPPHRVDGTAIFLTATPDATPHALLHNLNHNKVLHERVVFLTVEIRDVPVGVVRGARDRRAPRPRLLARAPALRLHEPPRRDARARRVRHLRPRLRPDADLVLPLAPAGGAEQRRGVDHGALARAHVRHDGAQRGATSPTTSEFRPTG
jgi:KUP system potassium uptake protein